MWRLLKTGTRDPLEAVRFLVLVGRRVVSESHPIQRRESESFRVHETGISILAPPIRPVVHEPFSARPDVVVARSLFVAYDGDASAPQIGVDCLGDALSPPHAYEK